MQFHIPYHVYSSEYPTKRLALYHAIRDSIASGILHENTKLPSSRELAALYGMSRGTVSQVYDMLSSEGYISSGVGRGTFVSFLFPNQQPNDFDRHYNDLLSDWGKRLDEAHSAKDELHSTNEEARKPHLDSGQMVDFQTFGPDLQLFPAQEWHRFLYSQARLLADSSPVRSSRTTLGDGQLRASIAHYLRRTRGIAADPEQVVVCNGSAQALALAAQLFISPGDRVVVEKPSYAGAVNAFQTSGGICIHAPLDAQGIIPDNWDAKLLLVTPNRQFPTGAVLPLERRQKLLAWASEHNSLIIEDDYDSVFRHRGKSLEPLKALDREERVIYIGSFSNTLLPNVRIGYAILPLPLIPLFAKAKSLFDPHPSNLLEQRTLAAWMQSGQYERHLRRMKRVYSKKFKLLRELLNTCLSSLFEWIEGDAGLNLFGWWRHSSEQYITFRSHCSASGIFWVETSVPERADNTFRYGASFNFPRLSEESMVYGINKMRDIWLKLEARQKH
ncbi:PLP-dependent aminotransferase family protein [Paenibacillaceae bacterium]|nr:PLP-dependent aminotransferase family protein [Paenibacillaceae bacterium]